MRNKMDSFNFMIMNGLINFNPGMDNFIKEMKSFNYKKQKDFIEGEFLVVEINDKKLIEGDC